MPQAVEALLVPAQSKGPKVSSQVEPPTAGRGAQAGSLPRVKGFLTSLGNLKRLLFLRLDGAPQLSLCYLLGPAVWPSMWAPRPGTSSHLSAWAWLPTGGAASSDHPHPQASGSSCLAGSQPGVRTAKQGLALIPPSLLQALGLAEPKEAWLRACVCSPALPPLPVAAQAGGWGASCTCTRCVPLVPPQLWFPGSLGARHMPTDSTSAI